MREEVRQRVEKKLLRITFPDGKVICCKSATMTFMDTLKEIGISKLKDVKLEIGHLPILSKEVYPQFKDYMKILGDGWYVNTQSDTGQKYMQLVSINKQLGLDLSIEIGTNFTTTDDKVSLRKKREAKRLIVRFPDGTSIDETNPIYTYCKTIQKIGIGILMRKGLYYSGKPLVTTTPLYNNQVEIEKNRWITVPPLTKEKCMILRIINSTLHLNLEVIQMAYKGSSDEK